MADYLWPRILKSTLLLLGHNVRSDTNLKKTILNDSNKVLFIYNLLNNKPGISRLMHIYYPKCLSQTLL